MPGLVRLLEMVAQAARPPALGAPVRAGHQASPTRVSRCRRACTICCAGMGPARSSPAARSYFFDRDRQRLADRLSAQESGLRRHPAPHRGARARAGSTRAHRRGDRRGGRTAPVAPGDMTLADLAGYAAKERQPVCVDYRGDRICGMGPPSSGGHRGGADAEAHRARSISAADPDAAHAAAGAASHRGGREARLRRPQPLPRRPRFRAGARRPARSPAISTRAARSSTRLRPWARRKPGEPPGPASRRRSATTQRSSAPARATSRSSTATAMRSP